MDGSGRSDGAPATSAARARALEAGGLLQLLAHACRVTGSPWAVLLEPGARTPVLASGTPPDAAALATAHRQQIPGPEAGGLTLALAPDAPAAEEAEALAGFAATLLSAGAARTGATRLREAFDVLQEGIILFDASGGLEFTNAKFREAHAFPPAALRPGTRFEEFLRAGIDAGQFPEAAGQEDSWFAARMAEHRRPEIRTELRLPGDRHVRIYVREMSDGSRIGLRVDVTDLRRSEAELSAACARAEAANRSKDAFLAMLSHEIRTPVNGVVGLADALAGRPVGAEERHLALALRETGAMLLAMIDDILDLARMDAGRFSLVEAPFAPAEALEAVAVAHAGRAETRGVALRTEYRGAATARRQGDGTRVRQILHNLVSNAVKFTEEGRVDVRIDDRKPRHLVIEVADTGIGMSAEAAARIFEPFEQGDQAGAGGHGGSGLGLAIVRRLVDAMGGHIALQTHPGFGSRFTVTLPLARAAEPERAPERDDAAAPAALPKGLRVLAVDDHEVNRLVVSALLAPLGVVVATAAGGAAALDRYRSGEVDLLLLDIAMPGMDGIETLSELRAMDALADRPAPPAIAVTGETRPGEMRRYRAAGFDAVLSKPLRRDELVATIAGLYPRD